MKNLILTPMLLLVSASLCAQTQDFWIQRADFGGGDCLGAFGFSISNKGYVGCGNFWEYDPLLDSWSQKADFEEATAWTR
ncbi:MAG: hypothetical protein IPG01_18920 [Chitinophagaceae bacterium]|nr:hypothetical protein [Chitinophagaceae bacterium]